MNIDMKYVTDVLNRLSSQPTAQDLDFLCEAFTRIGYYAAAANTDADMAEATRKHMEATEYVEAKQSTEKVSDTTANAMAAVKTWEFKQKEVELRGRAKKLLNLQSSIEQAINAIKHLERMDPTPQVRFPK